MVIARADNADRQVETGNSMAAGGGVLRPLRKMSLGDLHIRSRENDRASACREIRAILRQIRDSLQADADNAAAAAGAAGSSAVSNRQHMVTAAPATANCVSDEDGPLQSVQTSAHQSDDERPGRCDVQQRQRQSGWRHCGRLSLPPRLRPAGDDGTPAVDGEADPGASRAAHGRRRVAGTGSVRFADELGMNLNTFAMIPPRQLRDDSPTCTPPPCVRASSVTGRRPRSPPPHPRPHDNVSVNGAGQPLTGGQMTTEIDDELDTTNVVSSSHQNGHEQFRLCFNQPFAELEHFRWRLDRQMVCLENVRVDDWAAAGTGHHGGCVTASNSTSESSVAAALPHQQSSLAANSVILCSIQTKNSSRHAATVFARCTSDNWRTYADLPAERVSGLDSLGLGYDRYCFAVRRPATPAPLRSSSAWNHQQRCDGDADLPSAAVEFAICYQLADCAHWDNNDEANYRIEWFQHAT